MACGQFGLCLAVLDSLPSILDQRIDPHDKSLKDSGSFHSEWQIIYEKIELP